MAALRTNVYLRELYLADNKMLPVDGLQLAALLRANHSIEVLDLRNNQLQVLHFSIPLIKFDFQDMPFGVRHGNLSDFLIV